MMQKSRLTKRTRYTITDPKKLETELTTIRKLGYGVDREESTEGACCIGAPIRDFSGSVVASISASMPAAQFYQWHEPQLASLIKLVAGQLSGAIGYEAARSPTLLRRLG